jgi:hypothetical protein
LHDSLTMERKCGHSTAVWRHRDAEGAPCPRRAATFSPPQPPDDRQPRWSEDRARFLQRPCDFLGSRTQGNYYEFGSHTATTFHQALTEAHRYGAGQMEFYSFDSFEGFPEEAEPDTRSGRGSRRGRMATSEKEFLSLVREHSLYLDRVHTVKGFYSGTLIHELQAELLEKSRIAFAFVDCVLYESARDCSASFPRCFRRGRSSTWMTSTYSRAIPRGESSVRWPNSRSTPATGSTGTCP